MQTVNEYYFYDEELRQTAQLQLEQLTLQNDLLQSHLQELSHIRQINLALLVIVGACLGALIFRHLRK